VNIKRARKLVGWTQPWRAYEPCDDPERPSLGRLLDELGSTLREALDENARLRAALNCLQTETPALLRHCAESIAQQECRLLDRINRLLTPDPPGPS
jgi:hypothetical protein